MVDEADHIPHYCTPPNLAHALMARSASRPIGAGESDGRSTERNLARYDTVA